MLYDTRKFFLMRGTTAQLVCTLLFQRVTLRHSAYLRTKCGQDYFGANTFTANKRRDLLLGKQEQLNNYFSLYQVQRNVLMTADNVKFNSY